MQRERLVQPGSEHRDAKGRFVPGNGGRAPGCRHRVNRVLKECIIMAAEQHGEDGHGRGQLTGFLRMVIRKDLKSFIALMGRCIPTELHVQAEQPVRRDRTFDEADADLQARGLSGQRLIEIGENMRQREAERQRLRNGSDLLN